MRTVSIQTNVPGHCFQDLNAQPIAVKQTYVALSASANQQVIAAVTGKALRILGGVVRAGGATSGSIVFLNGSGGASVFNLLTIADEHVFLDLSPYGWFETGAGNGLYADASATAVVCLRYIEF